MHALEELYTTQDAAQYLGVSRKALRGMVKTGYLTPLHVGRIAVYTRKNLDEAKQQLFAEGMTHSDIANYYGVNRSSVAHHFKRLHVKPIGQNNHRRGGVIYDFKTVKKFADLLGWEPLPQNPADETADHTPVELESR